MNYKHITNETKDIIDSFVANDRVIKEEWERFALKLKFPQWYDLSTFAQRDIREFARQLIIAFFEDCDGMNEAWQNGYDTGLERGKYQCKEKIAEKVFTKFREAFNKGELKINSKEDALREVIEITRRINAEGIDEYDD